MNSKNPTLKIYCDESGFTGYNLLDSKQPIFAVASASIEEKQAEELLKEAFPKYKGAEYKFSNILGSTHQDGLLTLAAHFPEFIDRAFVYVIDKRFAVLTKIVDFLIEPYITDAGYDFYNDGFCWKYTNYIYFGLTHFAPPELLDALLDTYQAFSRNPSPVSLAILQNQLEIMASSADEQVRIFLKQMAFGANLFNQYNHLKTFKTTNELQMTTLLAIVGHWRQKHEEDFEIVHDASSNFFRSKKIWDQITNSDVPKQMHRVGDGTFVEFPLRVLSTVAADSRDSRSLQFCDILAGLTARHFSPLTSEPEHTLINNVIAAGLKEITHNGIRPSTEFPDEIPPKRLTGPDVVDQMTGIIFGPHNKK